MPELPEVETVRRGLEPVMAGARVVRLEQRRAHIAQRLADVGFRDASLPRELAERVPKSLCQPVEHGGIVRGAVGSSEPVVPG